MTLPAPSMFSRKGLIKLLQEFEGCIGIDDDITAHGHIVAEYDAHLWKLMEVAQK